MAAATDWIERRDGAFNPCTPHCAGTVAEAFGDLLIAEAAQKFDLAGFPVEHSKGAGYAQSNSALLNRSSGAVETPGDR